MARVAPERRFVTVCHNFKRYQQREVTMEFIEAHAEVSYGQQWPVEQKESRDVVIARHIEATEKELNHE